MICKSCGKPLTDLQCACCGKRAELVRRSMELDVLMASQMPPAAPAVPVSPAPATPMGQPALRMDQRQPVLPLIPAKPAEEIRPAAASQPMKKVQPMAAAQPMKAQLMAAAQPMKAQPMAAAQPMAPAQPVTRYAPKRAKKKSGVVAAALLCVLCLLAGLVGGAWLGYRDGYSKGDQAGYDRGNQAGYHNGYMAGFTHGESSGYEQGKQDMQDVLNGEFARGFQEGLAAQPTPPPSTPTPTPILGGVRISKGDQGEMVMLVQQHLIRLGYLPAGSADGIFGSRTEKAVIEFQKRHALPADGVVDMDTLTALTDKEAIPREGDVTLPRGTGYAKGSEGNTLPPDAATTLPEASPPPAKDLQEEEADDDADLTDGSGGLTI